MNNRKHGVRRSREIPRAQRRHAAKPWLTEAGDPADTPKKFDLLLFWEGTAMSYVRVIFTPLALFAAPPVGAQYYPAK